MPIVAEIDWTAWLNLVLLGKDFVDENVVGSLKQPAFDELEPAAHRIEFIQMDARNGIERIYIFDERAGRGSDMWFGADNINYPLRHGERKVEPGAFGGADDDIRSSPSGTRG